MSDIGITNTFTSFAFLFRKKNYVKETMHLVQDLIRPPSIYLHVCTLFTCMNTCMPRFSPSGFFGPSRCLVPTLVLTSEHPRCSVFVCVRIRTHTPAYTPTRVKNREDTDNTSISPFVKNKSPRRAASAFHRLVETPHPCPPTLNEQIAHT